MSESIAVNQESTCRLGPYKGYSGLARFDSETEMFHGEVAGTRDVITFQAPFAGLKQAFTESIDDYLEFCEERGEKPEKPYSGRFVVRVPPDVHRDAAACAESQGESLNLFIQKAIRQRIESTQAPHSKG